MGGTPVTRSSSVTGPNRRPCLVMLRIGRAALAEGKPQPRRGAQGKAGEGRGRQGKAGEGRGRQGKAGEGRAPAALAPAGSRARASPALRAPLSRPDRIGRPVGSRKETSQEDGEDARA